MIAKIFEPCASFEGVFYNFHKIEEGNAELLEAANFGPLEVLDEVHPVDYCNYLEAVSALNTRVSQPQLHAVISTEGENHDKKELAAIAKSWLEKMYYVMQPYLLFFHPDTKNNHVHIVSTRIGYDGRKINSGFERMRSIAVLNNIMKKDESKTAEKDIEKAKSYSFSNLAQYKLILERQGYTIKDNELIKFGKKLAVLDFAQIKFKAPNEARAYQLKAIFEKYKPKYDTAGMTDFLKSKMGIELVFHSKDGKPAYGYTVMDHAQKNVYKGSEIMLLKDLMNSQPQYILGRSASMIQKSTATSHDIPISIKIARDVDDQAVHGRKRKKKNRNQQR
jgi:Relaxase/Mobilisation nuclease domain